MAFLNLILIENVNNYNDRTAQWLLSLLPCVHPDEDIGSIVSFCGHYNNRESETISDNRDSTSIMIMEGKSNGLLAKSNGLTVIPG